MEHVKVNIDISQYMQSLNSEFQSIHNLLYAIAIMLFAIFVLLFGNTVKKAFKCSGNNLILTICVVCFAIIIFFISLIYLGMA